MGTTALNRSARHRLIQFHISPAVQLSRDKVTFDQGFEYNLVEGPEDVVHLPLDIIMCH